VTRLRQLSSHHLHAAGIPHAFTTRLGADVDLGLASAGRVRGAQVHGAVVAVVGAGDSGRVIEGADGLATADPQVVLAVHAADCVMLLLADPRRRAVAAVHAGWRGTAAGIAVEAVTVMADRFGCRPEDLRAAIGPCIGPCHYEVDEPVLERLRAWPWWAEVVTHNARGRWQLDLREANRRQLRDAGVPAVQIETLDWCTFEHPDLFFSYRRDGPTGQMAALIACAPPRQTVNGRCG